MPRENPEEEEKDEKGNVHTNYEVHMDGMAITYFTFKTVPEMVEGILEKTGLTREKIDYYIFHQANKFMMEHVKKKCGIVGENFYNEIEEIGNTVSGTIPFGIEKVMKKEKVVGMKKVMIAGYGVGLSWAGCIVNLEELRNE